MGKKILIIDDDRVIQDSLHDLFTDAGYAVILAADGINGFELITREKPDIIISDILLPRMHGIALCEKIRANDDLRQIPIILMTGVYKDVNLRMYVHKGLADDFIEKPFRETELLGKIEHFLGRATDGEDSQPAAGDAALPGRNHKSQDGRTVEQDLDELINWAHSKVKK
jgi:two-component system, OmpR family, alkaline phosphatase synthesis response regulator PhoP